MASSPLRFAGFAADAEERAQATAATAAAQQQAGATAAADMMVPGTPPPEHHNIGSPGGEADANVIIEQMHQMMAMLAENNAQMMAKMAEKLAAFERKATPTAAAGSADEKSPPGMPGASRGEDPLWRSDSEAWKRPVTVPPGMQEASRGDGAGAEGDAVMRNNGQPGPKPLDKKDIEKPSKYSGNVDSWLAWSKSFRKFLRRTNDQWPDLLSKVEDLKGKPVTTSHET